MTRAADLQWRRDHRGTLELRGKVWTNRYTEEAVDPETGEIHRRRRRDKLDPQIRSRVAADAELDRLWSMLAPRDLKPGAEVMAVDYLDRFLAVIVPTKLKEATSQPTYKGIIKRILRPAFKGRRLADVDTLVLQSLLAEQRKAGKSPNTLKLYRAVALRILKHAALDGFAVQQINPRAIPLSAQEDRDADDDEQRWISREEATRILAAASHPRRAFWATLYFAGPRGVEAVGLRRRDVDFEKRVIRIRQNAVDGKAGRSLKTKRSRRDVPMLPELAAILTEYLAQHWQPNERDLLFPTSKGTALRPDFIRRRWLRPLLEQLGIDPPPPPDMPKEDQPPRVGLHAFRHGTAVLLAGLGYDLMAIQHFLGHSDAETTQRYLHAADVRARTATDALYDQQQKAAT